MTYQEREVRDRGSGMVNLSLAPPKTVMDWKSCFTNEQSCSFIAAYRDCHTSDNGGTYSLVCRLP